MTNKIGLFWFTNDLRLHDQPALSRAANGVDTLICFAHSGTAWSQAKQSMTAELDKHRRHFHNQSLASLDSQLKALDQRLWVTKSDCLDALSKTIDSQAVTDVFRSEHAGWYENQLWDSLQAQFPLIRFHTVATHTLFDDKNRPFSIANMPAGFNGVRKKLEKSEPHAPIASVTQLPPLPVSVSELEGLLALVDLSQIEHTSTTAFDQPSFVGGEQAGLDHLVHYLASGSASTYKQTRNALDGWQTSCKFSPWLASGCLSVRKVMADLKAYEAEHGANESTYWIYVELLWREYFQWYAHRHAHKLYTHGGQANKQLECHPYERQLQSWIWGETAYPLVNACMTELRLTGFLSNRGRQIVASCLVNELAQDWRDGAAYFEQVLIDFDVATNWGNWQYIAGAGPENVNKKHFNLEKQAAQFDPKQTYINTWLSRR